ncbi:MAG: hypothetical protein MUO26_03170 [Methanotrichaceae archaeon]|nr:hypothetical protein [Methanotrichaceae archaeon]
MLTAEVIPLAEKNLVSLALQRQGFRILSIGETITIEATPEFFENFFQMKMEKRSKNVIPGIPGRVEVDFWKPLTQPVIPDEFKILIKEILFPEPPEFYI